MSSLVNEIAQLVPGQIFSVSVDDRTEQFCFRLTSYGDQVYDVQHKISCEEFRLAKNMDVIEDNFVQVLQSLIREMDQMLVHAENPENV